MKWGGWAREEGGGGDGGGWKTNNAQVSCLPNRDVDASRSIFF